MLNPPSRLRNAFVMLGTLSLFAAACGGASETATDTDQGIASLAADASDTAPTEDPQRGDEPEAPNNPEDAFALFNECMGDLGFDFGSVGIVGGGEGGFGAPIEIEEFGGGVEDFDPQESGGSFEDFDAGAFEEANEACEGHLAGIDAGFDLTPEQEVLFEDAQIEFAACMGELGIDVPEIGSVSGGIVVESSSAEVEIDPQSGLPSFDDSDFDFEAFEEAAESCQYVFEQYEELDDLFGEAGQ